MFFNSQSSTLPYYAPGKFYLSTTFGLSFMMSSVAPTRSSPFYAYLITKIGNRNLKLLLWKGFTQSYRCNRWHVIFIFSASNEVLMKVVADFFDCF